VAREMAKVEIGFENHHWARELFGPGEERLRDAEQRLGVQLVARGTVLRVIGERERVERAEALFRRLFEDKRRGAAVDRVAFEAALRQIAGDGAVPDAAASAGEADLRISVPSRKRVIVPRTEGQEAYVRAMREHDMVFSIGPAGTGKTYLAMAMAVSALTRGEVDRIILARPAVEAGESLGFLPGDMYEKVLPYLRPLYDALYEMMEIPKIKRLLDTGVIEVAPLAFMRGRTLNDSFIILDEAQNSTSEQMKMFLTRMGFGSKVVVTGDITQVDLPVSRPSGLIEVSRILEGIEGIRFCWLSERDVVRHALVQKIVRAYEERQSPREARGTSEAP
jgi:phosphate starvation-inducible PhoH-like protein